MTHRAQTRTSQQTARVISVLLPVVDFVDRNAEEGVG